MDLHGCDKGASSSHFNKSKKDLKQETEWSKSKSEESCELENVKESVVAGTALDNHVILNEIFGYLSPPDLKRCCEVNQLWRAVADPRVFEYRIRVVDLPAVEVETRKGCIDPKIQKRSSHIAAEMKFLEKLKRPVFIALRFYRRIAFYEHRHTHEFKTRFGSMVYRLALEDHPLAGHFRTYESFMNYSKYFPNVEELRFFCQGQITDDFDFILHIFWINFPLRHVQKLYFHYRPCALNYKDVKASRILELVPNVREIHGVPVTMIQEFQHIGKLHVLRSVVFCKHNRVLTETEGMRMLVQAKVKFRFLFIGKKFHSYLDNSFIQTNKESFKDLMELGKDTIEHFVLRPLKPKSLIAFPNEMPAVKHIGLWGISGGSMYFEQGEELSKRFPNVNTISFHNFTERMWAQSKRWWLPGGMFHSDNFRRKITCLKSNDNLKSSIKENLLDKFLSVKEVDIETDDSDGDYYIAGEIIWPMDIF